MTKTKASKVMTYYYLPDVHTPFHRKTLWKKVLNAVKDSKPYGVILGGDFMDMYSVSGHNADSLYYLKDITLAYEYSEAGLALGQLEAVLPRGCDKHYIYGNHEDRYFRELARGDRAKYGAALKSPEEALALDKRGWQVYRNWKDDSVRLGEHLECIHGIYCPVHAAKKHLDEFQGSVIFGHTHRWQVYSSGKRVAYNVGWLGDPDNKAFGYAPRAKRNQWTNGFAKIHVLHDGTFTVEPVQCYNDRFFTNGKMY